MEAVVCMQEHSLIRFSRQSGDEIVVLLHSMVSEWLRFRLEKAVILMTLEMAVSHLMSYVESVELDSMERQEELLHMESIPRIETRIAMILSNLTFHLGNCMRTMVDGKIQRKCSSVLWLQTRRH